MVPHLLGGIVEPSLCTLASKYTCDQKICRKSHVCTNPRATNCHKRKCFHTSSFRTQEKPQYSPTCCCGCAVIRKTSRLGADLFLDIATACKVSCQFVSVDCGLTPSVTAGTVRELVLHIHVLSAITVLLALKSSHQVLVNKRIGIAVSCRGIFFKI